MYLVIGAEDCAHKKAVDAILDTDAPMPVRCEGCKHWIVGGFLENGEVIFGWTEATDAIYNTPVSGTLTI